MVKTAVARVAGKKKTVEGSIPDSLCKTIFPNRCRQECLWFSLKRRSLCGLQEKGPQGRVMVMAALYRPMEFRPYRQAGLFGHASLK
ncbi:hypothetical protein [Solidesulfovibrio magneticus]|uniref:hypothetical protein n=1 Tax=Solidesulfovibrio magneticus TaxID=184917 RepID=UPI0005BB1238|nr:hypothetical protein [Solidesulfovibrio magneticus]